MAAISVSDRLVCGTFSLVTLGAAGIVIWGTRRTHADITKEIKKSSPSTKPWLIAAKICTKLAAIAGLGTSLFATGFLAKAAVSGTFLCLSPSAKRVLNIASYGGAALVWLQYFIRKACR